MYNTQFKVKYNTIEVELINKLKVKTSQEDNEEHDEMKDLENDLDNDLENDLDNDLEDDEENYEYTSQDVLDICNKLYMDELISVFDSENIFDPENPFDLLNTLFNFENALSIYYKYIFFSSI